MTRLRFAGGAPYPPDSPNRTEQHPRCSRRALAVCIRPNKLAAARFCTKKLVPNPQLGTASSFQRRHGVGLAVVLVPMKRGPPRDADVAEESLPRDGHHRVLFNGPSTGRRVLLGRLWLCT